MNSGVSITLDLKLDLSDVRKQGQELGNILERALNKNTRTKALDSLERQIGSAKDKIQKMVDRVNDILADPIQNSDFFNFSDEFKQAYSEAKRLEGEVSKIVSSARELPQLANASISEIADFLVKENKRSLGARRGTGKGSVMGLNSAMAKDVEMLRQYEKYTKLIEQEMQNLQGSDKFNAMGDAIDDAKYKLQLLVEEYRRLSLESGNSIQNGLQPIINFNQEISQTVGSLRQAFGPYLQIATTAMSALVEVTKLEIKALAKVGETAIFAFKPLVSLAQGAAKAVGGIFDSIKKHNETTMKNLWRNVLRYGIGVRSMYFLIRKIRAVIGDVINELSKQIPEVNAKMSAFKTAVNGLKGALATAFQPILTAILPALTALINAVSKAIAVVGKFIALLTGQDFVYAATATQVDYAKSLDKTGKSAKKAKKELEGYLSPIDEINKYETKKDNDSGGGADDGGGFTLKKVPIEDWIKDFWDKLKKMWETGDFYELGKMLGDKLAKMLANIPWDKIRATARKLGKSLATLLNGVMDGEFDGQKLSTLIGSTFAQAINTAFEFLYGFITNFDWTRFGNFISEVFVGFFDNIDWNLITSTLIALGNGLGDALAAIFSNRELFSKAGDALVRTVNAIIYGAFAFLSKLDGYDIGMSISSFINAAISGIDLNAFVQTCNKLMHLILDTLITAVQTVKWDELGTKLVEAFNKIDFKGIFSKYSNLANSIVDAILDLLENFLKGLTPEKITEIGESIADALNNLDFQPERFGKLVNNLLNAILDIAVTAVSNIQWDKIADAIREFFEQIQWSEIFSKSASIKLDIETGLYDMLVSAISGVTGIGEDIVRGILEGIKTAFKTLANPFKQQFDLFIRTIKDVFGIHSPSTVFRDEIGKMIVQGLLDGIKAIIEKVNDIWEKLKANAIEKFEEIKNKVVEKIIALKDKAVELYQNIKDKIIEKVNNLKNDVVKKYEDIKTKVVEKIIALKDKAIEIYGIIRTKLVEIVTNVKTTVVNTWTEMKTSVVGIFESMWNKIKGVINSIIGGVESMVNGIISGLNAAIGAINTLKFDVPDWVPIVGGEHLGFSIPTISEISIPRLAQGAVIPPNKEFMAVLGDQKSGTNIETPLATMVEAFNQALRSSDVGGVKQINFLLPDRRTLAQYTIAGGRIIQTSTGKNPFELA